MPRLPTPETIRELAHAAGFDLVRFGPAELGEHAAHFDRWLDAGRAGEMDYLRRNREVIRDPQRFVAGARSTIALGYDYGTPAEPRLPGGGRVARYARGRDYHRSLGQATRRLRDALEREGLPHGSTRVGTDAVPVLERALAMRAGVGFLAKSSGIISPTAGPYLLLSELITTAELPFDLPSPGSCGTCTRCIDACPTDAIVAPFQVDARRCLSYTTIELRGSIPRELRSAQGEWVFGCDVCLEVCPFAQSKGGGRDATIASGRRDLDTHRALETYSLVGILELDEAAWERDWTGTAMRRATRSGLRRNAAVVLGNLGAADALPALERALHDPDEVVREHAVWAIGRIEPRRSSLDDLHSCERNPAVLAELRAVFAAR